MPTTQKQLRSTQDAGSSIIPALVGALALMGLVMGLKLQRQTRMELVDEQHALQQQLDHVTELVAARQHLPALTTSTAVASSPSGVSSGDLARLRAECGALQAVTNELDRAHVENDAAHAALDRYLTNSAVPKVATADFWPRDSWSFAGRATPDDAFRSFLWASDNGNLQTLRDGVAGEVSQELGKQYEGKSTDETAIGVMDEVSKVKSVQVLNREYQDADNVVLTVSSEEGDQPHTAKVLLKRVGNEWKVAKVDE